MLDMGFIHDVRKIVKAVPEERQTLLFGHDAERSREARQRHPVRAGADRHRTENRDGGPD